MTSKRKLPIDLAHTPLERHVRNWLNEHGADYDHGWMGAMSDLSYGGCASGIVGSLIYYTDTVRFFLRHKAAINVLLGEELSESGMSVSMLFPGWDSDDPLAFEVNNRNLLAWWAFERTADILRGRAEDTE